MDAFWQTLGGVLALCIGVIVLTLFFKGIGYLSTLLNRSETTVIKTQTFIAASSLVKVRLHGGHILDHVTFLGFTNSTARGQNAGHGIPFEISRMAVFRNQDMTKIYVPGSAIYSIEELPAQPS
jgi:hypothetical protein